MLKLHIWVPCLMEHGGLEERLAELALGLPPDRYEVSIWSHRPVADDNQYAMRLRRQGVPIHGPPTSLWRLASEWPAKETLASATVAMLTPLLVPVAILAALAGRRTWSRSWCGVRGRSRNLVGRLIYPDYERQLFGIWIRLRMLFARRVDIVHIHGYRFNAWADVALARQRAKWVIYEEHSSPSPGFEYQASVFEENSIPDLLIAVSAEAKTQFCRNFGSRLPVVQVPPIVRTPEARRFAPAEMAQGGSRVRIVCTSRLSQEKGVGDLLQAASLLCSLGSDIEILIYGSGPLESQLRTEIHDLTLDSSVILCGTYERKGLPSIFAEADIFVLPSHTEGMPLGLIEAMSYAMPIVATRVGGIPEVIISGENGLLVAAGDVEELAGAIITLVNDPHLRTRLGTNTLRSYLEGPFTPTKVIGRMSAIYSSLAEFGQQSGGDDGFNLTQGSPLRNEQ